jgi:DNA-binding MarR family transcriptional regulator
MERDPDDSPAELLLAAARALRRSWSEGLAPWDVSPHQSRALRVIARHQPTRLGVVADHLRVAPRSATEVVDGLEERGLVRRLPDATDRRAVLVELTDEGRDLLEKLEVARSEQSAAHLSVLTPREQEQLTRLLRKLAP